MKTFVLTEEQSMLRDLARDLARAEIRPRSEGVDHGPLCPREGMAVLAEAGLLACMAPEDLGGAGLGDWSQACVLEEVAKECASTAWTAAASAEVAECVLRCGTPAQRAGVVPAVAAGALAAAAGSGPGDGLVRAERTADGFVLAGEKKNVPNAGSCAWYLIPAMEGEALRWFLAEGAREGLRAEERPEKLGMKGCPLGSLALEGCALPASALLEGDAGAVLGPAKALDMAAIAAGIAQGALAEVIEYVNQRVQFGKTIAQFENTQQVLGELLARTEAARALVWDAAKLKDSGGDYACAAAMAKVAASDTACAVTRQCVQFMGGYGYSREYPVERKMRDAKMTELCGGTNEALQALIATAMVVR